MKTGDAKSATANGKEDDGPADDSKDEKDAKPDGDFKKVCWLRHLNVLIKFNFYFKQTITFNKIL